MAVISGHRLGAREENMAAGEFGLPDEIFGELNRAARTD
jgi:hypothetical protein